MLAVLGPSGSGKSTFLDMLSGRKSLGMMMGCTTLKGEAVSGTGMRRLAAYVVQVRQAWALSGTGLVRVTGSGLGRGWGGQVGQVAEWGSRVGSRQELRGDIIRLRGDTLGLMGDTLGLRGTY